MSSKSMPNLTNKLAGSSTIKLPGVAMQSLNQFLFPSTLENPDVVGRLELFAEFGPTDEAGCMRGGRNGDHVHLDVEIKHMVEHNCKEKIYNLFLPRPRNAVEAIVDTIYPVAMSQKCTSEDVQRILKDVVMDANGRMHFTMMQEAIFASQRQRLMTLITRAQGGKPIAPSAERPPRVAFQSKSAARLMEITTRKKFNHQEEDVNITRRIHSYSTLIGSLEDQVQIDQLRANVLLCRGPGGVDDKWDRYCAMRRTGRSSYVKARNEGRFNAAMDDGMANKHPSCSSLLAASAGGSSAAALLGAL